jgi:hypothetical protein
MLDKLRTKGWAMQDGGNWRATREGEDAAAAEGERSFGSHTKSDATGRVR